MTQRVLPDYAGGSIANLAASVLRAYGADAPISPCRADLLPPDLLSSRSGSVLFICDALGINQLRYALEAISLPSLNRLATSEFGLRQLTSVFPSTTTAALTTLHSAATPSQHGVLGHRQWMDELGALCDMLRFRTMMQPTVAFDEDIVAAVPSTCQRLSTVGVRSYNVSATAYAGSGFSALLNRGSEFLGYQSLAEIPHLIDSNIDRKKPSFHCAYWARWLHHTGRASPGRPHDVAMVVHDGPVPPPHDVLLHGGDVLAAAGGHEALAVGDDVVAAQRRPERS